MVNLKRAEDYDVYIGRSGSYNQHVENCSLCQRRPLELCSMGLKMIWYGNPFIVGKDGTRAQVIKLFEEYARKRMETDSGYRSAVRRLWRKRLGCFCSPEICHGHIYIKLIAEMLQEELNRG